MGQTLSVDFRQSITRLCARPAPTSGPKADEQWKPLFFTTLTSEEVGMYVTATDVRVMRRTLPQNLAQLIYRCMSQMAAFIEDIEAAYSGAASVERRIADDTSVLNAIRILAAVVPTAVEDFVSEPPVMPAKSTAYPNPPLPESPQAKHFHTAFFWQNSACDGTAATLPNVLATSRLASRGIVSLGEEIMELLTRLCFLSSWTLDKAVVMLPQPLPAPTAAGHNVIVEYLLVPGLFKDSVKDGALFFAREVKWRRYECVRALIACLTTPVSVGRSLAPNPFFDALADVQRVPLGPTLCCSLVNYISQYVSRGVVPFSSHFWAELPEAFLADSLELLSLMLGWPAAGTGAADDEASYFVGGGNSWWRLIHGFSLDDASRAFIAQGIFRVIENPLFAATTAMSGSQRRLKCVPEALQLAVRLASAPFATGFLEAFASMSEAFLFPLLFFFQLAKADREYFADAQCASYLLIRLSTRPEFRAMLTKTFDGVMPFAELPPPKAGATYGDVLALVLCDVLSPVAPKWVWPLSNSVAVILANSASSLRLQEGQCFEVFHALDFTTSASYSRTRYVDREALVVKSIEAVTVLCTSEHKTDAAPLIAALATVDIPARLRAMLDPNAPLVNHEVESSVAMHIGDSTTATTEMKEKTASPPTRFLLSAEAAHKLPLAVFTSISDFSHRVIAHAAASDDPLVLLRARLNELPSAPVNTPCDFEVTVEVKQYLTTSLWAIVHRHHLQPPIFDANTSKLFRPAIQLSASAIEALARENDVRIAAAAEAAAARRSAATAAVVDEREG